MADAVRRFCSLGCVFLWPSALLAVPAGSWDFEKVSGEWQSPGQDSGVIVEPCCPTNHVFEIVAIKPHHTRLILLQSEKTPDFIALLPAVTAGSFEAAEGSVGIVIVNTTARLQKAVVELHASGRTATLYQPNRTELKQ